MEKRRLLPADQQAELHLALSMAQKGSNASNISSLMSMTGACRKGCTLPGALPGRHSAAGGPSHPALRSGRAVHVSDPESPRLGPCQWQVPVAAPWAPAQKTAMAKKLQLQLHADRTLSLSHIAKQAPSQPTIPLRQ